MHVGSALLLLFSLLTLPPKSGLLLRMRQDCFMVHVYCQAEDLEFLAVVYSCLWSHDGSEPDKYVNT